MNSSHSGNTAEIFLSSGNRLNSDQYEIIRVIGHGGFGITYLGKDLKLEQKVAIKEYFPHGFAHRDPGNSSVQAFSGERKEFYAHGLERYIEEARTLARFSRNHGIVNVLNFFEDNGTAYMVMEFLEGETIKDWLASREQTVSWDEAIRLLTPIMETLKALHAEGVIHRDVSPDNIFLCSDGTVKVLDFGAARYAMGEQSKSLSVILKQGYAPMEQYMSKGKQGPWTDIYALTATLYRMVAGGILPEAIDRVMDDEVPHLIESSAAIPLSYNAFMNKALAFRYEERYQDMTEYLEALTSTDVLTVSQDKTVPFKATEQEAVTQLVGSNINHRPGPTPNRKNGLMIGAAVLALMLLVFLGSNFDGSGTSNTASSSKSQSTSRDTSSSSQTGSDDVSSNKIVDITQAKVGDMIQFGHYEQDNKTANGKEPITWKVLAVENGRALLISDQALDCKKYNDTDTSVTWESCSLRYWLNKDFVDAAFSLDEQSRIAEVTLSNPDNSQYHTKGGDSTQDRIFLLSTDEAVKYISSKTARIVKASPYTKDRDAYEASDGTWWWLRSPGIKSNYAAIVEFNGSIKEIGTYVYTTHEVVVPALWINL